VLSKDTSSNDTGLRLVGLSHTNVNYPTHFSHSHGRLFQVPDVTREVPCVWVDCLQLRRFNTWNKSHEEDKETQTQKGY
jgi:hypothetical protein